MSEGDFQAPAARTGALAGVEEQRAIAETKAQIFLARQFPRDEKKAAQLIQSDCAELKVAEKAVYTYARGGTNITGPSIRLAEAIARRWGNLNTGVREIEQTPGRSLAQAFAWDTESNFRDEKIFEVSHVIGLKGGGRKLLEDPRDIYEHVASMGARRKRACILALIPAHIVEDAVKQCAKTLREKDPLTPEKLKKMLDAFGERGVSKEMIEARFQRAADKITPAQFVILRGIWQALEDGVARVEDHFEKIEPQAPDDTKAGKGGKVKEALKNVVQQVQDGPASPPSDGGDSTTGAVAPASSSDAPGEASPSAGGVDEGALRKELREKISTYWKGHENSRKAETVRLYAKSTLPDLTTAQLQDFWDNHCQGPRDGG